jgi:hypothetical protein
MLLNHRPTKILVTGNSGCGKSTFYTRYLLNAPQQFKFVYDHEGEFGYRNGLPTAKQPDELLAAVEKKWVIFDPVEMFPGRTLEGFEFFTEWTFNLSEKLPGTKLFACDELQTIVDVHDTPPGLRLILETGRRQGIDTILVTQQPNIVHNRIRNQLTEVVAFSQVDENAVKFLESLGFDGEEIRQLSPGKFVLFDLRRRRWQRGDVFAKKTISSSSSPKQNAGDGGLERRESPSPPARTDFPPPAAPMPAGQGKENA